MAYTTIVAGTTITAAWANANVRDQVVNPFATAAARDSAITAPIAGMLCYIAAATPYLSVYNGTSWVCVTPMNATQAASATRTNTAYGDLSDGAGPSVTIVTGTKALVHLSAMAMTNNTVPDGISMSYDISGATTLAASSSRATGFSAVYTGANFSFGSSHVVTGLTAGSNIFTAKYATVTAGTLTCSDRNIIVTGLP